MLAKLRAFFLEAYRDSGAFERKRAGALFIMLAALFLIGVVLALVVTTGFIKIALAAFALVIAGLAFLARSGRAEPAAVAVTVLIAAAFSVLLSLRDYSDPYEIFYLAFIVCFDVTVSSFVSRKSWLPLAAAGIGTAGVAYMYFGRALPHLLAAGAADVAADDFVIALLIGWANALIASAGMRRAAGIVAAAESGASESLARLGTIQDAVAASAESLKAGERLAESSRRSSSVLDGALGRLASAAKDMDALARDTGLLKTTLGEIMESSKTSSRSAEEQGSVVAETSAAIEEMTASIKNISNVTQARREAVKGLDQSTAQGKEDMRASTEAVKRMEGHAESILEVVKVISSVASQTNLLAMNAAIEAAHAGDYGRGFSVVADEIRKLSEQTGKSVKAISSTIKETIAAIRDVAARNDSAVERYARIAADSGALSEAMEEIIRGLSEMSSGTEEITQGVQASVRSTQELKAATAKVDGEISQAERALAGLDESSRRILDDLREVKEGSEGALAESRLIAEIGEANEEGLKRLGSILGKV